jgi:hypothetical protein
MDVRPTRGRFFDVVGIVLLRDSLAESKRFIQTEPEIRALL